MMVPYGKDRAEGRVWMMMLSERGDGSTWKSRNLSSDGTDAFLLLFSNSFPRLMVSFTKPTAT